MYNYHSEMQLGFRNEARVLAAPFCRISALSDKTTISKSRCMTWLFEQDQHALSCWDDSVRIVLGDDCKGDTIRLIRLLECNAQRLLISGGMTMHLQPIREDPGAEILRWRWMSFSLPPLLLIAAASPRGSCPPRNVRVLDPSLIPDSPVALLHAHWGALPVFELLWADVGRTLLARKTIKLQDSPPMSSAGGFCELLRRGFLIRHVLGWHTTHKMGLEGCTSCDLSSDMRSALDHLGDAFGTEQRWNNDVLADLSLDYLANWFAEERDGVDGYAKAVENDVVVEAKFLRDAFDYVDKIDSNDSLFETYFVQYIRIKCIFYRYLIADPDLRGLQAFRSRQQRVKGFTSRALNRRYRASTLDERGLSVRAVEVRCKCDVWLKFHDMVPTPLHDTKTNGVESAWIIHFSRTHRETGGRPMYRQEFVSHSESADLVARAIEHDPSSLRHLRGIDLAGIETNEPLWISLPSIRELRGRARVVASRCPSQGLEPLRLTLHVGEDFSHVASGLRAIHEPFAWNLIERGDRLGHATALGFDVKKWVEKNPTVKMTRWDRLLDIAWMRFCTWRLEIPITPHVEHALKEEARELIRQIWNVDEGHEDAQWRLLNETAGMLDWLAAGWLALGDPELFRILDFPTNQSPKNIEISCIQDGHDGAGTNLPKNVRLDWLLTYLWNENVQQRARECIDVNTEPDADLLHRIRENLARLVARWQVTIEVNPTSNLLVAGLETPLEQPMLYLRPLHENSHEVFPLAISTDDPITFATCLADEFAYAWAGIVVAGGMPASYARGWLEDAAATSMRARFTVSGSD